MSLAPNTGRQGMKLKLPTFDGTNSVEAFLAQFNVAAAGNGWGEQEKGWQLATSLRGTPSEILSHVDVQQVGGFQTLENALKLRYQMTSGVCRQQFAAKRQAVGESPQELADVLHKLATRSYPTAPPAVLDTVVSGQYIVALADDEVRRFVMLSHPQTLPEHVAAAMEAQVLVRFNTSSQVAAVGSGGGVYQDRRRGYDERSTNNNNNDKKKWTVRCWLCRGPHFQRNCPELDRVQAEVAQRLASTRSGND